MGVTVPQLLVVFMDRLLFFVALISGASSNSYDVISGSVLDVREGDNITLHCDCQMSTGVYIVWYRNCSHENQPSLTLRVKFKSNFRIPLKEHLNPFPRFHFVRNKSSESYDLLIENITRYDEGLYFCGTERQNVEGEDKLTFGSVYSYGNITRVTIESSVSSLDQACVDCEKCWILLSFLCPASVFLSSVLSFLLGYHCCQRKGKPIEEKEPDDRHQTTQNQDEDVCYAALEVRNLSQRPRKKETQSSDLSTYSAIRTMRT